MSTRREGFSRAFKNATSSIETKKRSYGLLDLRLLSILGRGRAHKYDDFRCSEWFDIYEWLTWRKDAHVVSNTSCFEVRGSVVLDDRCSTALLQCWVDFDPFQRKQRCVAREHGHTVIINVHRPFHCFSLQVPSLQQPGLESSEKAGSSGRKYTSRGPWRPLDVYCTPFTRPHPYLLLIFLSTRLSFPHGVAFWNLVALLGLWRARP